MVLLYYDDEIECSYATRDIDSFKLYDENYNVISETVNISPEEWEHVSIQDGDWSGEQQIPSEVQKIRADLDFLLMMQES